MHDKYIVYFISRTKAHMIQFIQNKLLENHLPDLIPTHGNILTALYESNKPLTMTEIASKIGKDKSTVTSLIHKLVTLGYIEKVPSTEDKRITYIHLTPKAYAIKSTFDHISSDVNTTAYKNFTQEEKAELLRLLHKLSTNFKESNNNS